ncbi:MAG: hypothetical protein ACU84Q_17035 [Gammaproteobacteria bacterium]
MNWEAAGAFGEILGAIAVVLTLGYVALQVRHAKDATADQNRLERARGVREMALAMIANPETAYDQIRNWGLHVYYEELAASEGISPERALAMDWSNSYYFWMYWGQYSSTTHSEDLKELAHVISGLLETPGMQETWQTSPMTRPLLEPQFVAFVDSLMTAKTK